MLRLNRKAVTIKSSEGFTLLEILLVMLIFIIISTITLAFSPQIIMKVNAPNFLRQLESDLYYIQQYALNHQQAVNFKLDLTNKRYFAFSSSGEVLVEQKIPNSIKIEYGSLHSYKLYVTLNGNFTQSGTWVIKEREKVYSFYFLIGKGRFYFNEL
ncbi:competence type IV pilus minor pilin ComGD [Peribacillus acanthi]|uniref:competence type IV pilus minor pilin ComGD n=1 Tax=Peribacillus acanthi TaxID=2171554 RepID=UPI000D3E5236|nr:competence type IV pilus minor pilin ComGD [Peribacillus acanthi]